MNHFHPLHLLNQLKKTQLQNWFCSNNLFYHVSASACTCTKRVDHISDPKQNSATRTGGHIQRQLSVLRGSESALHENPVQAKKPTELPQMASLPLSQYGKLKLHFQISKCPTNWHLSVTDSRVLCTSDIATVELLLPASSS